MALLYVDDFELFSLGNMKDAENAQLLNDLILNESSSTRVTVVEGVLSQKSIRIGYFGSGGGHGYLRYLPAVQGKIVVGFAFSSSNNPDNTPSGTPPIAEIRASILRFSSNNSSSLRINPDYSLTLGTLTTSPGTIVDSTYAYIEVVLDIESRNFELWVNNVLAGTGTVTFTGEVYVIFGSLDYRTGVKYQFFDDIYILDDTGTTHNQRLGPVRALRVPFNSTTEANFTPFGAVDNITAINKDSPNTSTFNRSPAANNVGDYFKLDTSVLPEDRPIIAVQQSAMYRKTDIGERALKLVAKEGADRKEHLLPERLATFSGGPAQILETAADGSAWDLTKLAATDFGYEVVPAVRGKEHKFWRINITSVFGGGTSQQNSPSLSEVLLKLDADSPNLAIGGIAAASTIYDSSYPASNAFDDDISTFWSANRTSTGWLSYQMINKVEINHVSLRSRPDFLAAIQSPKTFIIQSSDDGGVWVNEWEVVVETPFSEGETRTFNRP